MTNEPEAKASGSFFMRFRGGFLENPLINII